MEIQIGAYVVQIDYEDAERVASRHWTPDPRRGGHVYFKSMRDSLHRFILGCEYGDGLEVDHVSGDTLDNRRSNLRGCTHSENLRNQRKHKNNRSGFKGASYHKASGKFQAQITADGKVFPLGLYLTPEEAHAAYCAASAKYHKEFGRTA